MSRLTLDLPRHPPRRRGSVRGFRPSCKVCVIGWSGTFFWYDDIGLTNQVGAGPTFTPISTNPGTYTYWVNETDVVTSCVSSGVSVTYIINELPLIPIVTASMAWIFLNENLTTVDLIGFIIASIGVFIATRK